VTTALPRLSAGTDLNDRRLLVRKSLALSQSENLLHPVPQRCGTGSRRRDGDRVSSPELFLERRVDVMRESLEQRKVRDRGDHGIPVRMIFSRPILSESQPKTMKKRRSASVAITPIKI